MAEFNASTTSYESRIKLVDKFLDNMTTHAQSTGVSGILLAGDPGVGKTSFVKFLSKLLGIKLIVIEAPHITEEHIINIPFIVMNPADSTEKRGVVAEKEADYKIVLSQSHLVSQIKTTSKVDDAEYLKKIHTGPADIRKIFEKYGGNETTVPEEFKEVRDTFKCILFLDEFYRQTSTRIRNMLRGILNGNIGTDRVPAGTYVVYASNLEDNNDSVEGIPLNHQYAKTIEFKAPNKDDWFGYLVEKFQNDKHVKLNKRVIDEFYTILEEEDINFADKNTTNEIRTSPRRWEQLLLYVNAGIPVDNEKDAKGLITNVKANFKDYLTGEHSQLATKVVDSVVKLIKETSGINVSANSTHDDSEWRDSLEHQIKMKMKLGEHRKYIPIISGLPGIGKTAHAARVAESLNLRYIHIDCSTLDPEDVTGIPLSKSKKASNGDDEIETKFSAPKLFKHLTDEAARLDREYLDEIKDDKDAKAKYKEQNFKYLVFFDELNRTTPKVFNGLRRVILEKSFGDDLTLPEGSVVMAAINPHDNGTHELTNHMKDVVDVIDSSASWEKTRKYLEDLPVKVKHETSKKVMLDIIDVFANKFKAKGESDIPTNQRQFHLDTGAENAYISPREYADLYSNGAVGFDRQFNRHVKDKHLEEDELKEVENKLRDFLGDVFADALRGIFKKQSIDSPTFFEDLHDWFMHSDEIDLGEGLFYKRQKAAGFASIVDDYFEHPEKNLAEDDEFYNYIDSVEPQTFSADLIEFIGDKVSDDEKILKNFRTADQKKKIHKDGKFERLEDEMVTKFEHFFRELVHTFNYHKFSNDKRQSVTEAIYNAIDSVQDKNKENDDLVSDIMKLQLSFGKFVKGKAH